MNRGLKEVDERMSSMRDQIDTVVEVTDVLQGGQVRIEDCSDKKAKEQNKVQVRS
jgi:hypothetical protein